MVEKDPANTEAMLALASLHKRNCERGIAREWLVKAAAVDSKLKEQFLDPFDKS